MYRLLFLLCICSLSQATAQVPLAEPQLWQGKYRTALAILPKQEAEQQLWRSLVQLELKKPKKAYTELFTAEQVLPPETPLLALAIGRYHAYYREWKLALPALQQAEKSADRLPAFAQMLLHRELGDYYQKRQQAERALPHYQKAIALISSQADDWQNYDALGELKMAVGELHDQLLEPEEAVKNYRNILDRKEQLLRENPDRAGQLYLRIGGVYFRQKDYEVAAPYLEEALTYTLSAEEKAEAESLLGRILASREVYEEAIERSSEALSDWGQQAPPKQYSELLQFGSLCQSVEKPEQTRACYQKTLQGKNLDLPTELQNYAQQPVRHLLDPLRSENFNYALLAFERARRLIQKLPKPQQPVADIEVHMAKGKLFFNTKDFPKARYHYDTALELMEPIYEEKHPLRAEAYRMLSEVYLQEELYGDALKFVDKAINSSMQEGGSGLQWQKAAFPYELLAAIGAKGSILREVYKKNPNIEDLQQSLEAFEAALEMIYHLRRTYHGDGAKYKLAELTQRFSIQALRSCLLLYEQSQDEKHAFRAFDFAEAAKGTLLLESIRALRARQVAGVPQALSEFDLQLKQGLAYTSGEVFYELKRGPDKDFKRLEALRLEEQVLQQQHDSLLQVVQKDYPKYFQLKYDYSTIPLSELQEKLLPGETVLQYSVLDSSICLFVLRPEAWHIQQIAIPRQDLFRKVNQLLFSLEKGGDFLSFDKTAHSLYEQLLGKVADKLQGSETLIVLPDEELNYLPFELLLTEQVENTDYQDLPYALRDYAFCYHYTGTLLAESRTRERLHNRPFAAFAPDFTLVNTFLSENDSLLPRYSSFDLNPLPAALLEAQDLSQLLSGRSFTGESATEAHFWKYADSFSVLHLATHAILNDKNPLYSGLALQGGGGEDGLVHAYELYNHYLPLDLVTLSACNSGLGEFQKGEGAMSLAHAFSFAGTQNVVMSLWPVDDQSTQLLMNYFYANLAQGMPKAKALQRAKLHFLEAQPRYLHPRYWSPFLVVGHPDAIPALQNSDANYLWYVAGAIGLLLLAALLFWLWKKRKPVKQTKHEKTDSNLANRFFDDEL